MDLRMPPLSFKHLRVLEASALIMFAGLVTFFVHTIVPLLAAD
jgi:hypothetical protein